MNIAICFSDKKFGEISGASSIYGDLAWIEPRLSGRNWHGPSVIPGKSSNIRLWGFFERRMGNVKLDIRLIQVSMTFNEPPDNPCRHGQRPFARQPIFQNLAYQSEPLVSSFKLSKPLSS